MNILHLSTGVTYQMKQKSVLNLIMIKYLTYNSVGITESFLNCWAQKTPKLPQLILHCAKATVNRANFRISKLG